MSKKKPWRLMLAGLGLAGVFGLAGCAPPAGDVPPSAPAATPSPAATAQPDRVLLTVDGYPVSQKEFALFLNDQRAAAAQYFYVTYGVEPGPDFWTTEYGGQTPSEYCKELALEAVVRYKVERILAQERGLTERVDFSDLMDDMEARNQENAERIEQGEVVYGLPSFDPWQYLTHIGSENRVKLLDDEVERQTQTASDEVLMARYEADKERYNEGDEVVYERLSATQAAPSQSLEAVLEQVAEKARQGGTLAEAANQLEVLPGHTVQTEKNTEIEVGKDDFWEQSVQEQVLALAPGEVSEPLFAGDTGYLLRCIERTALGYQSFEDAKGSVLYLYAQETLEQTIAQRAGEAQVAFPDTAYAELIVE